MKGTGLPKLSIITITYNSEAYLEDTIKSVLSQDYTEFEYLIIDGASKDKTVDIIKSYASEDTRIKWVSEPDKGISDAFNKGIALASGEIVGIINSDDRYLPGAFSHVMKAYNSNPSFDVFHGDMLRLQGEKVLFHLVPADVKTHIWREMPVNHPTVFVTKKVYEKVGGFELESRIAMDYDLVLRLYKAGFKFCYIPEPLAAMRYGGASDTGYMEGLREVRRMTIREGYPIYKAWFWFGYKAIISTIKNVLRALGLNSLLKLHPRFRSHTEPTDN